MGWERKLKYESRRVIQGNNQFVDWAFSSHPIYSGNGRGIKIDSPFTFASSLCTSYTQKCMIMFG